MHRDPAKQGCIALEQHKTAEVFMPNQSFSGQPLSQTAASLQQHQARCLTTAALTPPAMHAMRGDRMSPVCHTAPWLLRGAESHGSETDGLLSSATLYT